MKQNVEAGYKETFCVSCSNTGKIGIGGSSHPNVATKTFDNAVAWQKMDCTKQFTSPPYDSPYHASPPTKTNVISFDSAGGNNIIVANPNLMFKLNYMDDCLTGGFLAFAAGCSIKDPGCATDPSTPGNIKTTSGTHAL